MNKKLYFLLILSMLLLVFQGCAQTPSTVASSASSAVSSEVSSGVGDGVAFDFIDSSGKQITFAAAPERIIALTPALVEILYALEQEQLLVAVGTYCNYPDATDSLEKLDSYTLNTERIIELSPDCLLVNSISGNTESWGLLEKAGIPVVTIHAANIAETYDNIALLGELTGSKEAATQIIDAMKADFTKLEVLIGDDKPTVYLEVMPMPNPWTCGTGTFQDELIRAAGGVNIFADVEGWQEVSEEQIIMRDPDIVITSVSPYEGYEDPRADILSRTNWQTLKAFQTDEEGQNHVFSFDADIISRPGPRLSQACLALFELLHDAPLVP